MHALTLTELKTPLQWLERPALVPNAGQVVVSIRSAALNRRDYWITQGLYPGIVTPIVLGSDGAGVVSAVGEGVDESLVGTSVILDPGSDWGSDDRAQSSKFTILGLPNDGTFATEVVVDACQVHSKPEHLDWNHAAALPLAGVTAFRAVMTQGQLKEEQKVLITGAGGGVAVFALQFALASGADVWVTSSSEAKIERAIAMGARGGVNYRNEAWSDELRSMGCEPDLTIDSAAGDSYPKLINLAAPGGVIVNYGATAGPPPKFDLFKVFWKQLRIQGSTMGSPRDFARMLEFISQHSIEPIVDAVLPMDQGSDAVASMKSSPQFGKIVLEATGG